MDAAKYWVIGSEFTDTEFLRTVGGTEAVFGPYGNYQDARLKWREKADATRARCHVRYTIVEEALVPPIAGT